MTAGLWTREAKRSGRGSSGPCDAGRCRDLEETCSLSAEWHASICLPEESTRPAGGAASSPPSASAPWGRWPGLRPSLLTRTHMRRGPAPPMYRPGGAGRSSSLLWLPGCALGLSRDVLGTPAATQAFPPSQVRSRVKHGRLLLAGRAALAVQFPRNSTPCPLSARAWFGTDTYTPGTFPVDFIILPCCRPAYGQESVFTCEF